MAEMKSLVCGGCGIEYSMPMHRYNELLDTGATFCCPNGCRRHFTDSTESRLKQAESNVEYWMNRYTESQSRLVQAQRRYNGLKGYVAKLKKRIAILENDNE